MTCENHCWHDSGFQLLSYPPQSVYICCNCGEKKHVTHQVIQSFVGHGKFHPQNMIVENK